MVTYPYAYMTHIVSPLAGLSGAYPLGRRLQLVYCVVVCLSLSSYRSNSVALGQTVREFRKGLKFLGALGLSPSSWSVTGPLNTHPSPRGLARRVLSPLVK